MSVLTFGVDFTKISSNNEKHISEWRYGMDVARLEMDNATHKREFLRWAEENSLEDIDHFRSLADHRFMTLGRMAWLMNNGAEMPVEMAEFWIKAILELRKHKSDIQVSSHDDDFRTLTANQKRVMIYVNFYSFIDAVRTKYATDHEKIEALIRKRIQDRQAGMPMLRKLHQHYTEELKCALSDRGNAHVAATVEPLIVVVNLLAMLTGNATVANASKKKLSAKTIKAASKAKVKNLDTDTNIVGLSPAMVTGNTVALVYNTKSRKVMIYVAAKGAELSIKGTYIIGYDEVQSFGKTLRKPKETFGKLLHTPTPKRINEILDQYIKGKRHKINGKLNKDTMIIRVFK